jgi:hypothetical protein
MTKALEEHGAANLTLFLPPELLWFASGIYSMHSIYIFAFSVYLGLAESSRRQDTTDILHQK